MVARPERAVGAVGCRRSFTPCNTVIVGDGARPHRLYYECVEAPHLPIHLCLAKSGDGLVSNRHRACSRKPLLIFFFFFFQDGALPGGAVSDLGLQVDRLYGNQVPPFGRQRDAPSLLHTPARRTHAGGANPSNNTKVGLSVVDSGRIRGARVPVYDFRVPRPAFSTTAISVPARCPHAGEQLQLQLRANLVAGVADYVSIAVGQPAPPGGMLSGLAQANPLKGNAVTVVAPWASRGAAVTD